MFFIITVDLYVELIDTNIVFITLNKNIQIANTRVRVAQIRIFRIVPGYKLINVVCTQLKRIERYLYSL